MTSKKYSPEALSTSSPIEQDIKRTQLLLITNFIYPLWTAIHHLISSDVTDSVFERVLVYLSMLSLAFVGGYQKISPKNRLSIMQLGRWILITHYFSVVARNSISVQYAVCAYFLTFLLLSLFTSRKYFLLFSGYILVLAILCGKGTPLFPGYAFSLGIATTILISYLGLSNRLKLLESLAAKENMFRSIFQNSAVGMITLNANQEVTMANESILKMLNKTGNEFLGCPLSKWISPGDWTPKDFDFQDQQPLNLHQKELKLLRSDGREVWARVSGSTINVSSNSQFVLLMIENIDQQKQAEQTVAIQNEKMAFTSKMTALGEMAGGVAHEINTPLTAILFSSQMVLKKSLEGNLTKEFIELTSNRIISTVNKIAQIVNGLRKFSRNSGAETMVPASVPEVINDTLVLCEETLKNAGIELYISQLPEGEKVLCRPIEISQVLLNLLNNAKDAVENSAIKKISIDARVKFDQIHISVIDSGPGVSVENQKKIFQPFFTTKSIGQGTGLGLSISIGIINSHGGSLEYDSNAPQSTFTIKLPRYKANSMENAS